MDVITWRQGPLSFIECSYDVKTFWFKELLTLSL
jgi:hypothetical protein